MEESARVERVDFTSVSFSRPARPAACRRLTENTGRDPEERSVGRTEGRKESTTRVETQRICASVAGHRCFCNHRWPAKLIESCYPSSATNALKSLDERSSSMENSTDSFMVLHCLIGLECSTGNGIICR